MKLNHRHYKKDRLIPRMISRTENDLNLVLLATPWGSEAATQLAFDEIITHLKSHQEDIEATTAYEKIETLNQQENDLRSAVLLANEKVFQNINRSEYISALELTVLWQRKHQITWLTSGGHQIQVHTPHFFSTVCGAIPHSHCPLPPHLVGSDRFCWVQCGSFNKEQGLKCLVFSDGAVQSKAEHPESSRAVGFWAAEVLF